LSSEERNQNTVLVIAAVVIGLVILCAVVGVIVVALGIFGISTRQVGALPTPIFEGPSVVEPEQAEPPESVDGNGSQGLNEEILSIEEVVANTDVPVRDRYDLAVRFNGLDPNTPPNPEVKNDQVGDAEQFFVNNNSENVTLNIDAELVYVSGDVYAWVEQGEDYDADLLQEEIDNFAQNTIPRTIEVFGAGRFPPAGETFRYHVLHTSKIAPNVAGYYYSPSEYPRSVVETSNERSMFYINMSNTPPGSQYYGSVLAHELQHLVLWRVDQNEETWLNEGQSELSARISGYGPSDFVSSFAGNPGIQLNNWPGGDGNGPHYGAGYLFTEYLFEQFGEGFVQAVVSEGENGLYGVDIALRDRNIGLSADDVFANWVVANYLDDPSLSDANGRTGIYGYQVVDVTEMALKDTIDDLDGKFTYQNSVHQYGTDYLLVDLPGQSVSVEFSPRRVVGEEPNTAPFVLANTRDTDNNPETDDRHVWWSNRGDDLNPRLTHFFDLTGVDSASLEYDVWFDLEAEWDYAYVSVSTDGGTQWDILRTACTTTEDPYGNAYGIGGYTGLSSDCGDAANDGWLHENIDLSAYTGQEILLRFEVVTDDAVSNSGMVIDNVAIPEISFYDDMEGGNGRWMPEGFIRHDNALRQRYLVQVITFDQGGVPGVQQMELDEENTGSLVIESVGGPAILTVSGLTRYTSAFAYYQLEFVEIVRDTASS